MSAEERSPNYCWAEPVGGHKWDVWPGVDNDSGLPLGYVCRWCTRKVLELPATPDAGDASEGLSEAERSYGRTDPGLQWRGRWYSEASVERILAAREAAARAEERERNAQAIEADANTPPKGSLNHRAYAGHFAALVRSRS